MVQFPLEPFQRLEQPWRTNPKPYDPLRNPCGSSSGRGCGCGRFQCCGHRKRPMVRSSVRQARMEWLDSTEWAHQQRGIDPHFPSQDTGALTKGCRCLPAAGSAEGKDPQDPATALAPENLKIQNFTYILTVSKIRTVARISSWRFPDGTTAGRCGPVPHRSWRGGEGFLYLDNTMLLKMPELEVLFMNSNLNQCLSWELEDHPASVST